MERRVVFGGVVEEGAAKVCESLQPLAYVLCVCVGLQAIFVDIGEEELSETSSLVCQCRK